MYILFCAAEQEELDCAISSLRPFESKIADKVKIDFMLTGIGVTSTCYNLTKKILSEQSKGTPVTLVVNIGLAGSYNLSNFPIGSVAMIESEHHGDLGFMTKDGFKSLFDAMDINANLFPYSNGELRRMPLQPFFAEAFEEYSLARGITVQTVTGAETFNPKYAEKYDIEAMEGAALFYVCLCEHTHFVELRAVSNPVGESDSTKWDTVKGLEALKLVCRKFFKYLAKE